MESSVVTILQGMSHWHVPLAEDQQQAFQILLGRMVELLWKTGVVAVSFLYLELGSPDL